MLFQAPSDFGSDEVPLQSGNGVAWNNGKYPLGEKATINVGIEKNRPHLKNSKEHVPHTVHPRQHQGRHCLGVG